MFYRHLGKRYDKNSFVLTPPKVAEFLHDIIRPVLTPEVVLDPCVGTGRLVEPWFPSSYIIGIDILYHGRLFVDKHLTYPFHCLSTWDHKRPDLILCNPPFNGGVGMMWPEKFLRKIEELFGAGQPVAMFVPHSFRLNQRTHSSRWEWLSNGGPKITSIVSLPVDTFTGVRFHSEVLIFNINGLDPHYWIPQI